MLRVLRDGRSAISYHFVAYYVALLYRTLGLLPSGHPYCMAVNIGRFGVIHVIAEAASRLQLRRQDIDKIFVFVVMLLGLAGLWVPV